MSDTPATSNEAEFEIDLGPADAPTSSEDFEVDLGGFEPDTDEDDDGLSIDLSEPEKIDDADAEADAEADASDEAVLAELREKLRTQIGDWYVIHTYSGMENRVKQNLDSRVKTLGMEELIFESVVPTEEVVETRNGTRKTVTRTRMPGYVLVRMDLTDESWSAVRHTPSVTGFVAHASSPVPLSLQEVEDQLAPAALAAAAAASSGPKKRTRKVEVADFKVGDSVMVVNGPFSGVHATITEINVNSQRLKALVEILGRETPVDLTFNQIAKV